MSSNIVGPSSEKSPSPEQDSLSDHTMGESAFDRTSGDDGGVSMPPPPISFTTQSFSPTPTAPLQMTCEISPSILSRLEEEKHFFGDNESAMVEIIRTADGPELEAARSNPEVRSFLETELNPEQMVEVARILYPTELFPYYVAWIDAQIGRLRTNKSRIFRILLELSLSDRQRMFEEHQTLFRSFSGYDNGGHHVNPNSEYGRVMRLCLGSEAQGMMATMEFATAGMGTRDQLLEDLVAETGALAREEMALQFELESDHVDGARMEEIETRLAQLGGIQENLLSTGGDDPAEDSFLDLMQDDLGRDDFEHLTSELGMDSFERAKLVILDSMGTFDDEEAVYRAIESIADPDMRASLLADPEIETALEINFNSDDLATAEGFAQEDNAMFVVVHRLENTQGWLNRDWEELFGLLQGLSESERTQLQTEQASLLEGLRSQANELRTSALDQIFSQGFIDPDTAIALGQRGWNNVDIVVDAFNSLPNTDRFLFRVGYALDRGHTVPETVMPADQQSIALATFSRIRADLEAGFGASDQLAAMDALVGSITTGEYDLEGGNELIAFILNERVGDRQSIGQGLDLSRIYSDAAGTADVAGESFESQYYDALADGVISDEERDMLMFLESNYQERFQEHSDAVNMASEIASTVAAVAVGIAASIMTGGAAAPFIAAALSGAAYVGSREITSGDNYDVLGEDGLRDGLLSTVDLATGGVTTRLATRLMGSLARVRGLAGTPLATALAGEAVGAATEAAEVTLERSVLIAAGAIEEAAEGAISGVVGEVAASVLDENTFNQSIQSTLTQLGEASLRAAATGAVEGTLSGTVTSAVQSGSNGSGGQGESSGDSSEFNQGPDSSGGGHQGNENGGGGNGNDGHDGSTIAGGSDGDGGNGFSKDQGQQILQEQFPDTYENYILVESGDGWYIRRQTDVGDDVPQLQFNPDLNDGQGGFSIVHSSPVDLSAFNSALNSDGDGFQDAELDALYQQYRAERAAAIADSPRPAGREPLGPIEWLEARERIRINRTIGNEFSGGEAVAHYINNNWGGSHHLREVHLDVPDGNDPPGYIRIIADHLVKIDHRFYIIEVKHSRTVQLTRFNVESRLTSQQQAAFPILAASETQVRVLSQKAAGELGLGPGEELTIGTPVRILTNQHSEDGNGLTGDDPSLTAEATEIVQFEY